MTALWEGHDRNFLILAYRELRALETDILVQLNDSGQIITDISLLNRVSVEQFYGIEIIEFPAEIARVGMWLMDHHMNIKLSIALGKYFVRLPLTGVAKISSVNALATDWQKILPKEQCSYIFGNPPFIGKSMATDEQKKDMKAVCGHVRGSGILDYVTGWYFKASEYIQGTNIVVGFVSTNSISQGEQVGVLWKELFSKFGIKIHFAYRTFPWESEARGKAHVHVVIVGFAAVDSANKQIFEFDKTTGNTTIFSATNINPYLVESNDVVITSRTKPLCPVPELSFGNMPNDRGHLLLKDEQKEEFVRMEPNSSPFIRPFLGSEEFINSKRRWCIWLHGVSPAKIRSLPEVMKRVQGVKQHRLASSRLTTRELANTPTLFGEIRQPSTRYLAIPKTSSERRAYIPMGFLGPDMIASTELFTSEGSTEFHFGILSSTMHMTWVSLVAGRLKSDYRYSAKLVYNNYPWPPKVSVVAGKKVETAAKKVLDIRTKYPDSSLSDLYDPDVMPKDLRKAHKTLDTAVERCYRRRAFKGDYDRLEHLFEMWGKLQ